MDDQQDLMLRVSKLERQNLLLKIVGVAIVATFGLAGWRFSAPTKFDAIQVRQLEVVDGHGVPVVTLTSTRNDSGGSIVLRDQSGDKRSWWESDAGSSRMIFQSPEPSGEGATIAGMSVVPGRAQISLLGAKGASLMESIQADSPSIAITNSNGATVFAAPWNRKG